MEAFQSNFLLDNQQQHPNFQFQSDPSINNDELVEMLAQELENLVISCEYEVLDRDLSGHSVVNDEEDEVRRVIGEELQHLVVKEAVNEAIRAESSTGSGEKENGGDVSQFVDEAVERHGLKKVLEEDPKECRVLEEREAENDEEQVNDAETDGDEKFVEHTEDDSKETHEIEMQDDDRGSEIVGYEHNGEEKRSDYGHDREFETVEDLENESENGGAEGGSMVVPDDGGYKRYHYPLRPDAEDCSYYMRTGMCKYGSNCKFNHPLRRRNQQPLKETRKPKEENSERLGQTECKYFLSGGCKYGKTCKFNHTTTSRGKTVIAPVVEYNFLGLPIRPGEKECPYYMRNGSCKYGPNCRFNHPDPTAVGGDGPTTYGKDGPLSLQNASHPNINMGSWSGPRTPDAPAAFVPVMYSPPQNMLPPNPEWNGYQVPAPAPAPAPAAAHVYLSSERGLPIPPAFFLNNPPTDTNLYNHQPPQMLVSDYPERPGQPECNYFMKTGDCKYRSFCKFHHPSSRITKTAPSGLSDKGLPLRPDQNMCMHFSRYGICKYGPACKYDHSVNYNTNSIPAGTGYGSDGPMIQQQSM